MNPTDASESARGSRLTYVTVLGSLALAGLLFAVYFLFRSQLALAQAADSLSDCLGGFVLAWAVRTSAQPADADHPHGHARAEPIAALVVAVLVGMLSVEVFRTSVAALWDGTEHGLDAPVAAVFVVKIVFKTIIAVLATMSLRRRANPALDALRVDARNDVLVGTVSVLGFGLAWAGWPAADPLLAMALAGYVAWSGLRLGRENITLLMGSSAPEPRVRSLEKVAASVPGVERIDLLVATFHGASLHVHAEVAVEPTLSLAAAHAIGHAVEEALAKEDDVTRAVVHVGPDGGH